MGPAALFSHLMAAEAQTHLPSLYLVGDSMVKTGVGNGETGKWGWGDELIALFDHNRIHVFNIARGGRSTRSFIEEGSWLPIAEKMRAGDFLMLHFGHNDAANSQDHPDRVSITGNGEQTIGTGLGASPGVSPKVIHTYGWYLRQYVADAKANQGTAIICSSVPRPKWVNGKIERGVGGYAQWAREAAQTGGARFLDLNNLASDRYDKTGQDKSAGLFADAQHTTKAGARINAEAVAQGLREMKDCALAGYLL
jgi:rhamnogalacturonan acetylesterase